MEPVYMDNNATTPLAPSVLTAISKTLEEAWGNPSSSHPAGAKAKKVIVQAREHVAQMLGALPQQIVFTSGGTESNNWVIESAIRAFQKAAGNIGMQQELPHVITSNLEHDSILYPLQHLEREGRIKLTLVPACSSTGAVAVEDICAALQPSTCLVTLMLANNETGILQPVAAVARAVKAKAKAVCSFEVLVHTDAAQAIGKIPVNVAELAVDFLTIVGHKFYAPRIGAVYAKTVDKLYPWLLGGGQERGLRSGTENTGMIAGLGEACRLVYENLQEYSGNMKKARDLLEELLQNIGFPVKVNGRFPSSERLPNTCNFSVIGPKFFARKVLSSMEGVYASAGAACHSDAGTKPSKILIAIGVPEDVAMNAMRWSVGRETSEADVRRAIDVLQAALRKLYQAE